MIVSYFFPTSSLILQFSVFNKVLISYIETAGSTVTRQKALKEQYLFTCTCPRCSKAVLAMLLNLGYLLDGFMSWYISVK